MRTLAFAVLVLLASLVGVARAQSAENKAAAEQQFNDGRSLLQAGRIEEACPKFEASLQLDPAPGTELNLADCYERLGRLASAWGMFKQARDDFHRDNNSGGENEASKRAAALVPKLSYLTLAPQKVVPGLVVTRNGSAVSAALLNTPIPVDAGTHRIQCTAPGRKAWTQDVAVEIGGKTVLPLPELVLDRTGVSGASRDVEITVEQPREHYEVQLATTGGVLRCDGMVTHDQPCRLKAPSGAAVLTIRGTSELSEDLIIKKKPLLVSVDKSSRNLFYGGVVAGSVGAIALGVGVYACATRGDDDIKNGTPTGITCVAGSSFGGAAVVAGGALMLWDAFSAHHQITLHGDEDDDVAQASRRKRLFTAPTASGAVVGLMGRF